MFSNPFSDAFGLDIGDLSIKIVQLQKNSLFHKEPHYKLINCRSISLPPGLIVNGEMQKPEEVRKYLQKLLSGITDKQKPIKSPWVIASLPETKSFIKLISIKKSPDELIEEDIINIAKKHIPFDEDNYYLEWQVMPDDQNSTDNTKVLIAAVSKFISDNYTYLLESLGLGVIALEIEALALARSMVTAQKTYENESRAILDLGATRTSLIVYDHNTVQFSTSLPYSGELLTTALVQKAHLSYEEAEENKKTFGLNYKENKNWNITAELTNGLINSIKNSFNFYYTHFPEANKIKKIIMCGGGANLQKLDKIISTQLKITTNPGNPWKNLLSQKQIDLPAEKSLGYATAIGLALRAADNPFFTKHIL